MTWLLTRISNRVALSVLVLAAVTGCAPDRSNLEPIPHPAEISPEAPVERQLADARSRLDRAMVRRDDIELAGALGALGDLYHAYGLAEPAAAAYRNAAVLEPESFTWSYALGLLAESEGDFTAAREAFERALALRPGDLPSRVHLGEILLTLGDAAGADAVFDAVATDGGEPYAAIAAYGRGRAAALRGDPAAAVEAFRRVLDLQPDAGSVRSALGNALRQLGDEAAATAELEAKASGEVVWNDPLSARLRDLPISSGAFLDRGNGALVTGRIDDAIAELSRGVEMHPEHVELRRDLGLAHVRANQPDAALSALQAAVEIDPDDARSWHDLGTVRQARGELDLAAEALLRAIELQEDYTGAHFNLANVYGAQQDWPAVERHAARVLELEPDTPRARYLMAMAQANGGDPETALDALRALVEAEPTEGVYRQGLVSVLAMAGRVDAAIAAATNTAGLAVDDTVELLRASAQVVWRQRRQRDAVELWRRVTELAPEEGRSWSELANGLQLTGDRAAARDYFSKARQVDPQNATAWLSEARLAILAGAFADAAAVLAEAVEVHPEHVGLADTAARLLATAPDPAVRDGDRAIQLARFAFGAQGSLEHAETLAMALAEAGKFEEAIRFQRGLAQQAQASGDRRALTRLVTNLRRFEQRQPVRMAASGGSS